MSTGGRSPSANDPSPELLREIRRVKLCKGYDDHSALIWEQRILDPPPVWIHLVRLEPPVLFTDEHDASYEIPHKEVTFHRIGVDVDNAGTWVRYGLSSQQKIPR